MTPESVPAGVIHIVPIGEEVDAIAVGLRHYPATGFEFVTLPGLEEMEAECRKRFGVLGIPIESHLIDGNPLTGMFRTFERILGAHPSDAVVVNVGAAGKHVACAAISASFVNGLNAFHVLDGMLVPLPIMRFSYQDQLGETKKRILSALGANGGTAEDMNDLVAWTDLSKSLLSYHLRGNDESRGLEDLGFVSLARTKRGRLSASLTTMGELVLIGRE